MDTAVARQFLSLFQDFLQISQLDDWPSNDTAASEIKNAFLIAHHIEKCLDKLQRRNIINEFLAVSNSESDASNAVLKNCFTDPPKYILKKIINSKSKITQMDTSFKVFLELFSEDKLEKYLSEIMVEAASKETLLRNFSVHIPKDKILLFKSDIFLNEMNHCENLNITISKMIEDPNQDSVNLLVISLLNKDFKYHNAVNNIVNTLLTVMLKRNQNYQKFWKHLFRVDKELFIKLCLEHADLCKMVVRGLVDNAKLLKENMSAEFFYINLTYSELVSVVRCLCKDEHLRVAFGDIVRSGSVEWEFWQNMLTS